MAVEDTTRGVAPPRRPGSTRLARALWVFGPGLMVMVADTDAGSVVTAAQSGARWGYSLLLLQVLLVPVLYLVMELTVRLGTTSGKGYAALVCEHVGRRWGVGAVGTLLVTATGALVTEFAGIAGVGNILGIPKAVSVPLTAVLLVVVVIAGSYRRVEVIGLALGAFELAFLAAALIAHPRAGAVIHGAFGHQPLGNGSYLALVAANIGAVVMPWMVFYQQGAVAHKRLGVRDLRLARIDTALGAIVTQLVMISVLMVTAASVGGRGTSLRSVDDISDALSEYLGYFPAHLVLGLGLGGAAMVAAIVVSLASAWAVTEVLGVRRSIDDQVRQAPLFYALYVACIAVGGGVVLVGHSLVRLAIDVEILNAILLPVVLGLLLVLAHRSLPPAQALRRVEWLALLTILGLVTAVGATWLVLELL
ncbi:MAG: NRAMP family divalent metal transporter [Gaiellaceae bacterium]